MKKCKLVFLASILALVGLSGCNQQEDERIAANDLMVTDVSLDITYKKLEVGESFVLTPTITYKDGQEVDCYKEWRSSNSKIASVSETGMVLAIKSGSAAITFIAGYKSASCSINIPSDEVIVVPSDPITPVNPNDPGEVTPGEFTISLNAETLELAIGSSYQLEATTSEQAVVSWASSNAAIVSVDNDGAILALAEGTATITATSNEKSASCVVTVSEVPLNHEDDDIPPDDEMTVHIYFFLDYNNVDEEDLTGQKLLAKFWWYEDKPIAQSGKVPANPTKAPTSEFPYFAGWSTHPIIDSKSNLLNLSEYTVESDGGGRSFLFIYGIWTDVQGGMAL